MPVPPRVCGACRFGRAPAPAGPCGRFAAGDPALAAPSAAAVLAFGRADFAGRDGILAQVAALAAAEQIHSASAYCEACRETTWLCDPAAPSLDAAVVDFSLHVQRARAVAHAVAVARARNHVPAP